MTNLLKTGATWLASQLKDSASETVVYARDTTSASVQAAFGSQLLRVSDGKGNTKIERTERDFLITAADLVLGGVLTTPQPGDLVYVALDGVTEKYEVMPPAPSEAAWRYSDATKTILRIHAKFRGMVSGMPAIEDDVLSFILAEGQ